MKVEFVGGPRCGATAELTYAHEEIPWEGGVYVRRDRPMTQDRGVVYVSGDARIYDWRGTGRDGG